MEGDRRLQSQMAAFQQVIDNYRSGPPTPPAGTSSPNVTSPLMEDGDGYLHPEVGIDYELERLLAENPGLYMEDQQASKKALEMTVHVPPIRR